VNEDLVECLRTGKKIRCEFGYPHAAVYLILLLIKLSQFREKMEMFSFKVIIHAVLRNELDICTFCLYLRKTCLKAGSIFKSFLEQLTDLFGKTFAN
jgi:hypothetical protein